MAPLAQTCGAADQPPSVPRVSQAGCHALSDACSTRRAMILNVNEPETRGMALALQTMLDDLGKG